MVAASAGDRELRSGEGEIEIITDCDRRRYWPVSEKLWIVEETLTGEESVSAAARRIRVAPNLLCRWRRPMLEGGSVAVSSDDGVTATVVRVGSRRSAA